MKDDVDGTGVILYIEPVAYILSLTINRQRLTMTDVIDEQRYQLLWELIRTIVIRAVGHYHRHTISIVISTHEVIR